jgi:hypothetical protein
VLYYYDDDVPLYTYTKRFIYSVNRGVQRLSLFFLEVRREITTSPLPERAWFLSRLRRRRRRRC